MKDPDDVLDSIIGRDTVECNGRWVIGAFQRMDLRKALRDAYHAGIERGDRRRAEILIPWAIPIALVSAIAGYLVGRP